MVAATVVVAALGVAVALADDESDRAALMSKLEAKLDAASNNLYNVQGNSSYSEIDAASNAIRDVESLVDELKRVAGSDSAAEKITSYYPGYVKLFYPAAAELKKLKLQQLVKGDSEAQCKMLDAELLKLVASAKDDPEAAAEIIKAARDYAARAERVMSAVSAQASDLKASLSIATNFSASDNGWRQVTKNLSASATAIATDWTNAYDAAKQACASLVKSEAHPVVAQALAKLAGSTEGRKQLLETVTKAIDKFATKISEVHGASGTSAVDSAGSLLDEVTTALRSLINAQGDDAKLKKLTEKWPDLAQGARDALKPLRELKLHHYVLDALPAKCDEIEKQLEAYIKDHKADADAVKSLPAEAERLGKPVVVGMELARQRQTEMSNDRDRVARFSSSDGPWTAVAAAFDMTASSILADYKAGMTKLAKQCGNIILMEKHPDVLAAIKTFETTTSESLTKLEADINRWVDDAKATYRTDCDGMKQIWEAYCGVDWSPTADVSEDEDAAKAVAVDLQKVMQKEMQPVLDQLAGLDARVNAVSDKAKGSRLAEKIDTQRARLERLKKQGVWEGNFSPVKQFAQKFGDSAHAQMWSKFSCKVPTSATGVADFGGSGKHRKPDCLVPDTCTIIEFKPNRTDAISKGKAQLAEYKRLLQQMYTKYAESDSIPDAAFGGKEVMDALKKNCSTGSDISLKTSLETYDICDMKYECTK